MPITTTASFYRRGIPNTFTQFGYIASANYTIGQPTALKININANFFQNRFKKIIYK
jgi:hypothetical protein